MSVRIALATLCRPRRGVRAAEGARLEIAYVPTKVRRGFKSLPLRFSWGDHGSPTRPRRTLRENRLRGAGGLTDERGDVLDLLFGELALEGRHHAPAVRHALDYQVVR